MKLFPSILSLFSLSLFVFTGLRAQPVSTATFDSTVAVWSGHTTVRERVDAGVNERIELWNRTWTVSPSGQVYENTDHWGFGAPDGYAATTITFNETGRWTYWASDGGSIDSWVYGDGPYDWYLWPHNPPNGVGYGGWGRRITAYIDVEPAPPANVAPTISWNSTPGGVASGQSYTISAHGHDSDGNLTQVNVWKNGTPFAFAGGGNGTDGDSGNPTSDTGPTTVTFTAEAVDSNGATSGTISQTVTVAAANQAPTIAWTSTPGTIASGQSYTVSAHGHDADGNLTQVNVWKNGSPFAFAGGGNGTDGDSGNPTSDNGPATITFTAQAVDSNGATSSTISQTVTVAAANQAPTIAWTSTPGTVANVQSYTVSAHGHDQDGNLTQVNVWKNGVPFAFAGGGNGTDGDSGNPTSDAGPTTVTFTAQAVDSSGATSAIISQTVTVSAPNNAPTAAISGSTALQVNEVGSWNFSASDVDGNLSRWRFYASTNGNPQWSSASGSFVSGSYATSFSTPGSYTWNADVQDSAGAEGSASITVNVTAPPPVSAFITASPTSATAPGSTTISWSTSNATSVSVSGNGVSSAAPSGSQPVSGLSAGTYTYTITALGSGGPATNTATFTVNAPANTAPTIAWNTTPGTVASGQSYTISAHGHDADGNLTNVNVWRNGVPYAFAGGGNGSDNDSGNPSTDIGPLTITYTAEAIDAAGALSGTISQTVTVGAPPSVTASISASLTSATAPGASTISWSSANATSVSVTGTSLTSTVANGSQTVSGLSAGTYTYTITAQGPSGPVTQTATVTVAAAPNSAPTIAWNTTPGTVASGQSYTISAHGHDADGNLTNVNVWRNGVPYAFAGGGNGSDNDSGNPSTDTGPLTITYTAEAIDATGAHSGTISQTVTITAPPPVTGSISASPTTATAPGSTTISWSTANATAVSVSGNGLSSTAASGSQIVSGLAAGTYNYTLTEQGTAGPITQTATVTISDGLSASITASPTVVYSNQTATLNWTTTGAGFRWVHGYQPGLNSVNLYPAAVSGSTTVTSLPPGAYRFTIEYGPGSSTTQMAFADLTVLGANRAVVASVLPAGTGLATGAGTYVEGSSATLTAAPDATHVFTGWSGDLSTTANPFTFTVGAQNYNVVANFALRTFVVTTSVSPVGAGSVAGAGNYTVGATATLSATPDATHVFTGWSGDLSGSANPVSFPVNNPTNVTANFAVASFTLTTAASGGGSVTPGGTYSAGTVVTVTATPDATHLFSGWIGDASGTGPTTAITLDRAKSVQANFSAKTAQTIAFDPPGDHGLTSPPFTLTASATSGLSVSFSLLSGPAILTGSSVQVTGAGPVTLQANQPGDAFFLPAVPVNQTFNVIAPATLKYRGQSRTLLRDESTREAPPFVLEKP